MLILGSIPTHTEMSLPRGLRTLEPYLTVVAAGAKPKQESTIRRTTLEGRRVWWGQRALVFTGLSRSRRSPASYPYCLATADALGLALKVTRAIP